MKFGRIDSRSVMTLNLLNRIRRDDLSDSAYNGWQAIDASKEDGVGKIFDVVVVVAVVIDDVVDNVVTAVDDPFVIALVVVVGPSVVFVSIAYFIRWVKSHHISKQIK
jgi:hypothetical protein